MLIALLGIALATPDASPASFELSSGRVQRLEVSSDGSFVAMVSDGTVHVLSIDGWFTASSTVCNATDVTIEHGASSPRLWVGCSTGRVVALEWDGHALSTVPNDDGESLAGQVVGSGRVEGVVYSENFGLFAVVDDQDSGSERLLIQPVNTVDASNDGAASELYYSSYFDTIFNESFGLAWVHVFHGEDDMSTYRASDALILNNASVALIEPADICASIRGGLYIVDAEYGVIWEYLSETRMYQYLKTDLVGTPTGILTSLNPDDEFLGLAYDDGLIEIYELSNGYLINQEPIVEFSTQHALVDLIAGSGGYSFGGSDDGSLVVLTSNPWVNEVAVSSSAVAVGDLVDLQFSSDTAGNYRVLRGGDYTGSGSQVAAGTALAGFNLLSLTIDSSWVEGDNAVYIQVTDPTDLSVGHARTSLNIDSPPSTPALGDGSLGFGDGYLNLSFDGVHDSDLSHYITYVSMTPFEPADWPTGGPEFDGSDELDAPFDVQSSGGQSVSVRIEPLTNDQTYYISVRAVDTGGLEGEMSNVVHDRPRPSHGSGELGGESGGAQCGAVPGPAAWWLMGAGALAALLLRRQSGAVAVALLALGLSSQAQAQDPDEEASDTKGDVTPAWGHFEVRYGGLYLKDQSILDVYGKGHTILHVETGPQFYRIIELHFGLGFYQKLAYAIDDTGEASDTRTMLTWYPVSGALTARLHIVDEQIIVPYVSIGLDYIFWNEKWDNGFGGKDKLVGGKFGWHWALGASFLLDIIDPGRASHLEAVTGINDTYITFEFRRQYVNPKDKDGNQGLDFSAEQFTVGLKLDF